MPTARGKAPHNVRVLQRWVGEHAKATGVAQQRLQRWISFMVVAAVLDAIRDEDNDPVFALKGGVAMELRLGLEARATKDYDAAYRERSGDMLERLDEALAHAYGDFTITRTDPHAIRATRRDPARPQARLPRPLLGHRPARSRPDRGGRRPRDRPRARDPARAVRPARA